MINTSKQFELSAVHDVESNLLQRVMDRGFKTTWSLCRFDTGLNAFLKLDNYTLKKILDAMQNDERHFCSASDAIQSIAAIETVHQSCETRKEVVMEQVQL